VSELGLLEFPTDYPIKVVGYASERLRAEIDAIVGKHAPDFDPGSTTERLSVNGRFVSISYRIRAVSAAQVEALAAELRASQSVVWIL
jgi:uncharacterized protein